MLRTVRYHEDSAGNRYYAEFDPRYTAPVRQWVERLRRMYIPAGDFAPEPLYIIDYQWEITQESDNQYPSSWNCWGP